MNALVTVPTANAEIYRASTDAAGLCREIVVSTAMEIQGRKYVKVEGWQAIAIAHGCAASACDVEVVPGGVRAIGEIRRMSDGVVIATAEGFVGEDEPVWFGGEAIDKWGKKKVHPRRLDYAIRAMAQTRAISRAARSAFAHVVVMMNAGLSTTPAEEVPLGSFDDEPRNVTPEPTKTAETKLADWKTLDDEMDRCKSKAALDAWNKLREADIKALPKGRADTLAQKFFDLHDSLPAKVQDFDADAAEVREFA